MRLSEAVDVFILDCEARALTVKSVSFYRQQLAPAVKWLAGQGVTELDALEAKHLRAYLVELQGGHLSAASQHAAWRSLRAWLNFCEREELLSGKNPARKVRAPKRPKTILPAVSTADVGRLLDACRGISPQRDRAIILVLVDSGIRASELCALTLGDLDGDRLMIRQGKGRKDRIVFVGKRTQAALADYLALRPDARPTDALFVSHETGHALTYIGLAQILKRLGARAGVKVHAHALRRTFAVESLRGGCDPIHIAKQMGHSDTLVLQRHYLPLVDDDLRAAHRAYGPVDHRLKGVDG